MSLIRYTNLHLGRMEYDWWIITIVSLKLTRSSGSELEMSINRQSTRMEFFLSCSTIDRTKSPTMPYTDKVRLVGRIPSGDIYSTHNSLICLLRRRRPEVFRLAMRCRSTKRTLWTTGNGRNRHANRPSVQAKRHRFVWGITSGCLRECVVRRITIGVYR